MSSESSRRPKAKLIYKNQNLTSRDLLPVVINVGNRYFSALQYNADAINTLILELATEMKFDQPSYNGILQDFRISAQEKFIKFSSLFQNCDDDEISSFIEFLLNYETLGQLRRSIEKELNDKFDKQIEISRGQNPVKTEEVSMQPVSAKHESKSSCENGYVIGEKDCPFNQVVLAMMGTATSSDLDTKWQILAMELGTSMELQNKILQNKLHGITQTHSLLQDLLMEWRARVDQEATLLKLIELLEGQLMITIAQGLRDKFRIQKN